MRKHPWFGIVVLSLMVGCTSSHQQQLPTLLSGQTFVKTWQADLNLVNDSMAALFVRDKVVVAYTTNNRGYWLGTNSGELLETNPIVHRDHHLFPPVMLADRMAIPTTVSIEVYDKMGKHLSTFAVPSTVQSPGAGAGESIYLGVTHSGSGGRLARYSVEDTLRMTWEMYTTKGIAAAPAVLNDTIFAGGLDGRVWAVTSSRIALWPLPDNSFKTEGPISADLAVDDYGLYVASEDRKLYCLDRTSGKIKWSYFAAAPLTDGPIVIGNTIYQMVPNTGLVAIKKSEGKYIREADWVQPMAAQVLASDEKYLYVRTSRNSIAALDIATGEPAFQSTRGDLAVFASNPQGSIIYAATKRGTILAIKPVLKPGTVGELVFEDVRQEYSITSNDTLVVQD